MKFSLRSLALAACLCVPGAAPAAEERPTGPPPWTYAGETGPDRWATLSPDYERCAGGKQQSPVELLPAVPGASMPFAFHYGSGRFLLARHRDGFGAESLDGNSALWLAGHRYRLVRFHLHAPAEHTLGGKRYPLELHLVHRDGKGRVAVAAVFVAAGAARPALAPLLERLDVNDRAGATLRLDANAWLPRERGAYTYTGSLTTPPCTEPVDWMVLMTPITMSRAQIEAIERLSPGNARPTQLRHGRIVTGQAP